MGFDSGLPCLEIHVGHDLSLDLGAGVCTDFF